MIRDATPFLGSLGVQSAVLRCSRTCQIANSSAEMDSPVHESARTARPGELARPKRFELLTPRFVVWCSIQLSYGRFARRPGNIPAFGARLSYRLRGVLASACAPGAGMVDPAFDRHMLWGPAEGRKRWSRVQCGDQRSVCGLRLQPVGCRRRPRRLPRGSFRRSRSVRSRCTSAPGFPPWCRGEPPTMATSPRM